ncbi:putative zinc protease-like protein y4wB [Chlorella vulgaris]
MAPAVASLPSSQSLTRPLKRPRQSATTSRHYGRLQCSCQWPDWRQKATAAGAALLAVHGIVSPLEAVAGISPSLNPAPLQQQQQYQQAQQLPTAPSLAEVVASLPPLPTDFPPLPPLALPKYQQLTLKNGLRVFLLEDHELPVVRGSLLMRGGQRASPADKVGLASLSAAVQRSGGSVQHPGQALDDALEDRAASIEGGAGSEAIGMGWQCLAEDAPEVLNLFAEVVTQPALPQDKLDLAKSQARYLACLLVLNALEHRFDNPSNIPARELAKLIYGRDSVFARDPTPQQIAGITRQDLQAFLTTWERPDAAVLGICGDFDSQQMKVLVEAAFEGWQRPADQPTPPPLPSSPLPDQSGVAGRLFLVDLPGSTQTTIAVGEPGIQMLDPDEYPLDVLDDMFNGFAGRLFNRVRSREGLAYSISGGWSTTPIDHPGLFMATAETAKPAALLTALRGVLEEAASTAPPEEEVQRAKQAALNQFVFSFASRSAQLSRIISFDLVGIPQDYVFKYRGGIEQVQPGDVLAAAQRRLHPAQQTVVVAGDAVSLRPQLRTLGLPIQSLELR